MLAALIGLVAGLLLLISLRSFDNMRLSIYIDTTINAFVSLLHDGKERSEEQGNPLYRTRREPFPNKADEMYRKSGQMGVPVVDVNGRVMVGLGPTDIEAALKR